LTTSLCSERAAVLGRIDPDAIAAGTVLSEAVDMSLWGRLMVIVQSGDLGASATLNAKLTESDASGGTYTDIAGKAITQLTQAGSGSDKVAIIELRNDELGEDKRYVKLSMTVGTATSEASAVILGFDPRYEPAHANDIAAVAQIVN